MLSTINEKIMVFIWFAEWTIFVASVIAVVYFIFRKEPETNEKFVTRIMEKRSDDSTPAPTTPPPKRPEGTIFVSEIFREISKIQNHSNWCFQLARIYRKRQCELERLLEENNIPFEKLDYKEAVEKAKQKIIP